MTFSPLQEHLNVNRGLATLYFKNDKSTIKVLHDLCTESSICITQMKEIKQDFLIREPIYMHKQILTCNFTKLSGKR